MQWYHQSGLAKATDERFGKVQKMFDNYKELEVNVKVELFSPEEMKIRFEGLYSYVDHTDEDEILWNPSSGWAEAARALKATTEAAIERDVHYISAPVSKLIPNNGCCTGIQTEDGRTFTASKVILSTGAYTAKLLAESAPRKPEIQVGDRITACAVCEAAVNLTPEQAKKFQKATDCYRFCWYASARTKHRLSHEQYRDGEGRSGTHISEFSFLMRHQIWSCRTKSGSRTFCTCSRYLKDSG